MRSVIVRKENTYKFFSYVYESKAEAEKYKGDGFVSIKVFSCFGDPADGWMNQSSFGFQEDFIV